MPIINSLSALYKIDNRRGDNLLGPQRWCNHQWSQLRAPLDPNRNQIWQLTKRIGGMALLVFPTLISYTIGFVGVLLKASDWTSKPSHPPFVELINSSTTDAVGEFPETLLTPPSHGTCVFQIKRITKDVFIYMATFLSPRQQLKLMEVSKEFNQTIRYSSILWSPQLTEYRIWGATQWVFRHTRDKGYLYTAEQQSQLERHPLEQIKAYRELLKNGELGREGSFLDYLARLMPGGPLAFRALPQSSSIINAANLQPSDMLGPIMHGKDGLGHHFLALHLIDNFKKNFVLVFTNSMGLEHDHSWEQRANICWRYDSLKITTQNVQNYILALIKREDLTTRTDLWEPTLYKNLRLANP